MDLTTLLAEHGGSIYFAAPYEVVGEAVTAAVREAYPDAKVDTFSGSATGPRFHFIQVFHADDVISSYMFADAEVSA